MIRVVMLGRLGNNLFQYAAGRVLSEIHGVPLVMDASWFNGDGWRQVRSIQRLPLRARVVRRASLFCRGFRRLTGKHPWEFLGLPVYREAQGDQRYDPAVRRLPENCVLMGYFQSPLYFRSLATVLRGEINTNQLEWSRSVAEMAARLHEENSVAVHVRRTDYLGKPEFNVCRSGYYERAMEIARERISGARLHVFSDDPEWCRRHMTAADVEVVDLPESRADSLVDLHLMRSARHHVIANSSYSWWAAWLAARPGQIVFCPSLWYTSGSGITAPIQEKLCDGWETVEVPELQE